MKVKQFYFLNYFPKTWKLVLSLLFFLIKKDTQIHVYLDLVKGGILWFTVKMSSDNISNKTLEYRNCIFIEIED